MPPKENPYSGMPLGNDIIYYKEKSDMKMNKSTISVVDRSDHLLPTILLLAWPIFLEQVLTSLAQSVDTAMVGSLGANATAAVAISQSPNMLINGIIMALGIGFTSMVARSVGAKEFERVRLLIRQSLLTIAAVGLPLSLLCFLLARQIPIWMGAAPDILDTAETYNRILALSLLFRSLLMVLTAIYRGFGDAKTPMITNICINIANVIGNFLLIYPTRTLTLLGLSFPMPGAGLGVTGAAIATSLSATLGSLALLANCFLRKDAFCISIKDGFRPDWKELSTVTRISLPAMLERFTMSGASIVVMSTIATLGTAAVAANSLAGTAESLSFMPGFAFGTSVTTLVGQSLGANREDLAKRYVSLTCRLGSVVMLFMSCVLFFGSRNIISLFTPDLEVIEMGSILIKILAIIQIPQVIAMVYSGALKGAGDTKSPFLIALISMWGVRILGVVVTVRFLGLGINAVCVSMCCDNVVRCILFHLRYKKTNWSKTK